MLHLILEKDREKINGEVSRLSMKLPIMKLDVFSWDADLVRGEIDSRSLFEDEEKAIVIEGLSENEEHFEILKTLLSYMHTSSKIFIVVESEMLKESQTFFENLGASIVELKKNKLAVENKWGGGANPFAIADALGRKSSKDSWLLYVEAIRENTEPEELHGRLVGKVRDMLASASTPATELGMHPFVYKKSRADLKNWKPGELEALHERFVSVYHQSRMSPYADELGIAIEKILLQL